jgi:hypothetical protein
MTMKSIFVLLATLLTLSAAVFGQNQPRIATLSQQKMCAEQAAKFFHEDTKDNSGTWSFTNHYNASTNVCYLMEIMNEKNVQGTTVTTSNVIAVLDAFEGREYAWFTEIKTITDGRISSDSGFGYAGLTECKQRARCLQLIDKYFGIAE